MTWQGGKLGRASGPTLDFACLKAMAGAGDDPGTALNAMAKALGDFPGSLHIDVRLVTGGGERIEHWDVQAGTRNAKARQKQPKDSDVVVQMRPETWLEIAEGRLAPYEALYSGRLRVGGDLEAAKSITRHLSDPASTYQPPC